MEYNPKSDIERYFNSLEACELSKQITNRWQRALLKIAIEHWNDGLEKEAIQLAGFAMLIVRSVSMFRRILEAVCYWDKANIDEAVDLADAEAEKAKA
jgi:hypothetical protein